MASPQSERDHWEMNGCNDGPTNVCAVNAFLGKNGQKAKAINKQVSKTKRVTGPTKAKAKLYKMAKGK